MKRRLRAITLQGTIISQFGGTNNIFTDSTYYTINYTGSLFDLSKIGKGKGKLG